MSKQLATLSTVDKIAACSDSEALLIALKQCAGDILRNIARMAAILRRLDELGVKVEIDHALLPYIRMIAKGSLSAECFMACSGDPELLTLATKLPPELQKKLAANEPFEVVSPGGEKRRVGALDMSRAELSQVFVANRERTEYEKQEFVKRTEKKLPFIPCLGQGQGEGRFRCPECGGKTSSGGGKCLACKLKDKNARKLLENVEEDSAYWESQGNKQFEDGENPNDELSEGWQERLAQVRAAKESGNEVGFHVDWLMSYIDEKSGSDDFDTEKLMVLLEKLSASFGYDLSEAAA